MNFPEGIGMKYLQKAPILQTLPRCWETAWVHNVQLQKAFYDNNFHTALQPRQVQETWKPQLPEGQFLLHRHSLKNRSAMAVTWAPKELVSLCHQSHPRKRFLCPESKHFPFPTLSLSNPIRFLALEDGLSQQSYDRYTAVDVHLLKEKRVDLFHLCFYQCQIHVLPNAILIFDISQKRATRLSIVTHLINVLWWSDLRSCFLEKQHPGKTSGGYCPYTLHEELSTGIKLQSRCRAATWHSERWLYQSYLWASFTEATQKYLSWQHSALTANTAKVFSIL